MDYDFTYTGAEIQAILDTAKKLKDSGYIFLGVATPSTNPGTPTQKVYYEAKQAGTYTNFGGVVLPDGISLLKWNGSWTSETVMCGDGGVFDISVYKSSGGTLATFADLSDALDGGNNIPVGARKGGMSVKFVQSSDNKYQQFRLMKDEWSINTDDWSFCGDDTLVENPEFIAVYLDKSNRLIKAVRNDGKEYLAAGLEVHGEINTDGADITMIESPEFFTVWLDKNDKVLFGVQKDGNFLFGCGVPKQVKEYIEQKIEELSLDEYESIVAFIGDYLNNTTLEELLSKKVDGEYVENPEFLEVKIDAEYKVLEGIQQDGTKVIGGDLKVLGNMEVSGVSYKVIENPEYLAAWLDTENKVIFGLKTDGKTYVGDADFLNNIKNNQEAISEINATIASVNSTIESLDIDALTSITATENPEFMEVELDAEDKVLGGRKIDGTKFENVGLELGGAVLNGMDDPEGRMEVKTDSEQKIISYRKEDGTLVENTGIETNEIKSKNLETGCISCATLNAEYGTVGKVPTPETELYIEKPKFAEMRLYGTLPTDAGPDRTKTKLKVKFIVDDNVIFSSLCKMAIQGHGSAGFPKHNYSIDFLNADEDKLSIKFGDMISVDGYHLKGFMDDRSQARCLGSAAIWRDMVNKLGYPYSIVNNKSMQYPANYKADSVYIADAKYSEDGFPLSLYVNDEFWGLYSIKLKKNRKNYAMEKSVKQEIFLDSITYTAYLQEPFDHTDWELKNPSISGYEEGGEITDATVLANIERLFDFTSNIEDERENYADFVVLPHWVLYVVFGELVGHWDVDGNNTELCTWDGTHWSILPYDMDVTALDNSTGFKMRGDFWATFRSLFEDEIKTMYTDFRKKGFIEAGNLFKYYTNQVDSIPRDVYDKDYKKWGNENTDERYLNILFIYKFLQARIEFLDSEWLIS